jgi:hypothetical protein
LSAAVRPLAARVALAAALSSGPACAGVDDTFPCSSSAQCVLDGEPGMCVHPGLCAFADPACTSLSRFGPYAGERTGECVPADEDLVAHWPLDDGSGATAADSVGGHDGELHGAPSWIQGQIDGALSFDGIDDYIVVADADALNSPEVSVAFWLELRGGQPGSLLHKLAMRDSDGWLFWRLEDERVGWSACGAGACIMAASLEPLAPGWHHVLGTFAAGVTTLYVDGAVQEVVPDTQLGATREAIYIGMEDGYLNPVTAALDDVRIYRRSLAPYEAAALAGR